MIGVCVTVAVMIGSRVWVAVAVELGVAVVVAVAVAVALGVGVAVLVLVAVGIGGLSLLFPGKVSALISTILEKPSPSESNPSIAVKDFPAFSYASPYGLRGVNVVSDIWHSRQLSNFPPAMAGY
jgi:hypothetical protein